MYVIPIVVLTLLIAIGAAWSPIFALIIAVPLFILFLAYVGLSRRADQGESRASGAPASGEGGGESAGGSGGMWGEKRT